MTLPVRPVLTHDTSHGSTFDEYRSVIDDLTIQNKKLKQKLKKLKTPHLFRTEEDKLFEVKIHGLSWEKKRELKDLLGKFAENLTEPSRTMPTHAPPSMPSAIRLGVANKPSASLSSTRVADSGYGSLSHCEKFSTPNFSRENTTTNLSQASRATEQNIYSRPSDIRQGLLPRHPTAMSEGERKKLVVRRLEEIFGGRGATPSLHQQSLQQEEILRLAAKADVDTSDTGVGKNTSEGLREARIMDFDDEDRAVSSSLEPQHIGQIDFAETRDTRDTHMGNGDGIIPTLHTGMVPSPEQRPTRPLDLDPQRAQIPEDNRRYIRHLGLTSPDTKSVVEGEKWLYLNLLSNMAQLHTLNVTPDFIRRALSEFSSKFELSSDGRKARWRGGEDITRTTSSESGESLDVTTTEERGMKRKRLHFVPEGVDGTMQIDASPSLKRRVQYDTEYDKFKYRPLFPQKATANSDSDMAMTTDLSSALSSGEDGLTKTLSGNTAFSAAKRNMDGPIIFYNNAKYCTDLSGDMSRVHRPQNIAEYECLTRVPLGVVPHHTSPSTKTMPANLRPLITGMFNPENISDAGSITSFDLESARSPPKRVTFADLEQPFHFEVSGIGGVYPEDNYAITVLRQHFVNPRIRPRRIFSSKLDGILPARPTSTKPCEIIKSESIRRLRPSQLPPPTFAYDDNESSDSDMSDSSDEEMDMFRSTLDASKSNSITICKTSTSDSEASQSEEEESDDDASEGSLDFLADARAQDPDAIRAMEREYDADVAERWAEEIPAGSSAATAGGGSACASPDVGGGGAGAAAAAAAASGEGGGYKGGDAYMGGNRRERV